MHLLVQPPLVRLPSLPTPFFPPSDRVLALIFWVQPSPAHPPTLPASLGLLFRSGAALSLVCFTCTPDATPGIPGSFTALGLKQRRLAGTWGEDLAFSTQGVHTLHLAGSLEKSEQGWSKRGDRGIRGCTAESIWCSQGVWRRSSPRFAGSRVCTHLALAGPSNPGCLCSYVPAYLCAPVAVPWDSVALGAGTAGLSSAGLSSPQSPFHCLPPRSWAPLTPQGDLSCCCYF